MMVKQAPADATLKANSHLRLRQDTEVRPSPTEITMLKTAKALPKRVRRTRWQPIIFVLVVLLPSAISAAYLYGIASDQFVSEFRFHVRHAQPSAMDTSSPVSGLTGAASVALQGMTNSEIVVQYLQSRKVLDDLRPLVDIEHIYARPDADWFARLSSNEPIENQLLDWRRVVDPFFDLATGIITVKVRAFDPAEAQQVSEALLGLSEKLVNSLSDRAKYNKLNYARQEVEQKVTAMRETELALRDFRNRNAVLFPNIQATNRLGWTKSFRIKFPPLARRSMPCVSKVLRQAPRAYACWKTGYQVSRLRRRSSRRGSQSGTWQIRRDRCRLPVRWQAMTHSTWTPRSLPSHTRWQLWPNSAQSMKRPSSKSILTHLLHPENPSVRFIRSAGACCCRSWPARWSFGVWVH